MARIIAIAGLPGSGKTTLAQKLAQELNAILIDDPDDITVIISIITNSKDRNIVITDPYFCFASTREKVLKFFQLLNFEVEWLFFDNDPASCQVNHVRREGSETLDIPWFSKQYVIPPGAKVIPVWKNDTSSVEQI